MTRLYRIVASALVSIFCVSGSGAWADDGALTRDDLHLAVTRSLAQDDAARNSVRTLLRRDEFQTVAAAYGLDARRAEAAVGTLSPAELRRVSALAAKADSQLSGGSQRVSISLVSLLLIIIIVILVAN